MRGRLRTLSKENADRVGRHLVMVGRLIDDDPEAAYEHAQAAVRRAGRVDVVREAAGLAAYRTGRFAEALRELRTVRRLNGSSEHLPVMADAELGLGRPERAIALSQEPEAAELDRDARVELAMVVSGARLDLGQPEAAVAALTGELVQGLRGVLAARVAQARAAALEAAGLPDAAAAELAPFSRRVLDEAAGAASDDDVVVYDLVEDEDAQDEDAQDEDDASHEVAGAPGDEVAVRDEPDDDGSEAGVAQDGTAAPAEPGADARGSRTVDDVTGAGSTDEGTTDEGTTDEGHTNEGAR
ncbi:hypothetical protein [Cellulomonas iranensis]|uniref:hypothetical protein n=1 Tax=Cellulomonas iranensis TaxID=76862 RepID=UPI00211B728D|nr:hypothetical protein [Cellulomonas iranensis]